MFEKCAALGRTPLQWKMSKIIPFFKKVILRTLKIIGPLQI
jgi:hypothetical protein